MNEEARQAVMKTPLGGCLIGALMLVGTAVLGLWTARLGLVYGLQLPRKLPSLSLPAFLPLIGLLVLMVSLLMALRASWPFIRRHRRVLLGLRTAGGLLAALQPGLLAGAGLTLALCAARPWPWRYLVRGFLAGLSLLVVLAGGWHWAWFPLLLAGLAHPNVGALLASIAGELGLGALWLRLYVDLTTAAEIDKRMVKQGAQLEAALELAAGPEQIRPRPWRQRANHRVGRILLGVDRVNRRALELPLSALSRHVTLIGSTGSGKTTTVQRLADGCLAQPEPWSIVILDAKGGALRHVAVKLAEKYGLPFQEVNPGHQHSYVYNPCALGSPAEVAGKLCSAFEGGPESAVYRDLSYHAVSRVAAAQDALGQPLALSTIAATLTHTALSALAAASSKNGGHLAAAEELAAIAGRMKSPREATASAISSIAGRLSAVQAGRFESVLAGDGPELDLVAAFNEPALTYLNLPATASVQDVQLVGRLMLADFKLVLHQRLASHEALPARALLVLDEFPSLGDPAAVLDLIRQAREARIAVVTAGQFLPDPGELRNTLLQVGALIFHQCLTADADEFAMLAGTIVGRSLVREIEFFPWRSNKGATGMNETFRVHPRYFRHFAQPGLCSVLFGESGRLPVATIARVYEKDPQLTRWAVLWLALVVFLTRQSDVSRPGPDVRSTAGGGVTSTPPAWQAGTEDEAEGLEDEGQSTP